jgi:hypothetical protein
MDLVPFRIASLLTGLTMVGDALALLVGMHIPSAGDNPWISVKNDLFLALDIVAGLVLLYFDHNASAMMFIIGDKKTPLSEASAQYALYNMVLYAQTNLWITLQASQQALTNSKEVT